MVPRELKAEIQSALCQLDGGDMSPIKEAHEKLKALPESEERQREIDGINRYVFDMIPRRADI